MNIESCFENGNTFPCGPVCEFQGQTLPTLYQLSEGDGISGKILTNILKKIVASGVIDRSEGVEPFLLVNVIILRLSVEFLWYINDVSRPWRVCIGLPYGTHKWGWLILNN